MAYGDGIAPYCTSCLDDSSGLGGGNGKGSGTQGGNGGVGAYSLYSYTIPPLGTYPNVAISAPSNAVVDVGQTESFTITLTGAVSASNYNANVNLVESGSPSTVANSIVKTITGGTTSFTSTNVITAGFVTDSPLKANVLISGGTGAAPYSGYSSTFTVNNQFLQTANSISNTVASQGQAELITASWTGGTSTYTANYFVVNSTNGNIIAHALYTGLSGTSNTFTFTIPSTNNALGTENVIVTLTDSASTPVVITSVNTITASPAPPPINATTLTLTNTTIVVGQNSIANSLISGGSGGFTGSWTWTTANLINTGGTSTWSTTNSLGTAVESSCTAYNGYIYCPGGYTAGSTNSNSPIRKGAQFRCIGCLVHNKLPRNCHI